MQNLEIQNMGWCSVGNIADIVRKSCEGGGIIKFAHNLNIPVYKQFLSAVKFI